MNSNNFCDPAAPPSGQVIWASGGIPQKTKIMNIENNITLFLKKHNVFLKQVKLSHIF